MNSPATQIPCDRDNLDQGYDLSRAGMDRVWSVGKTPRQAVHALAKARGWKGVKNFTVLSGGDESYTWGFRFTADGCGMKASGVHVPGGVICTWWK